MSLQEKQFSQLYFVQSLKVEIVLNIRNEVK